MGTTSSSDLPQAWNSGMTDLTRGCSALEELELSDDAVDILATIRQGLVELQARAQEACKWEQCCPNGGKLLRVQGCLAAGDEEPPEWSIGKLFIGSEGLFYESIDAPIWSIGPCKWSDLVIVHQAWKAEESPKQEPFEKRQFDISLGFIQEPGKVYVLSGIGDVEWLMGVWNQSWSATGCEPPSSLTTNTLATSTELAHPIDPAADDNPALGAWLQQWPPAPQELINLESIGSPTIASRRRTTSLGTPTCMNLQYRQALSVNPKVQGSPSFSPARKPALSSVSCTPSFFDKTDVLPDIETVMQGPTFTMRLPNATLEGIRGDLEASGMPASNDFSKDFYRLFMEGADITATPWTGSRRVPGTQVRRLRCRVDVPDDLPSFVKNALALPKDTAVTMVARLGYNGSRLVILQQTCTHDVPFGENLWLQEVLMFQPHPDGGIQYEKFVDVIWVAPLPWALRMVGLPSYIESQAKTDTKSDKWIVEYLNSRCITK